MVMDSSSVYEQVTKLCKKLLKVDGRLVLNSSDIIVKDLRSLSFEILLNKSNKPCVCYGDDDDDDDLDAMSKILAYSYRLYEWNSNLQASRLHKLMNSVLNGNTAASSALEAILLFLVNLADEIPTNARITYTDIQPFSTVLGTKVKPYQEFPPHMFEAPVIMLADKCYPFSCEPGEGLLLLNNHSFTSPSKVKWGLQEGISFSELTRPRNLMIPKALLLSDHQFKDEGYVSPSQDPSLSSSCRLELVSSEMWELAHLSQTTMLRSWESLGCLDHAREKPFLTEISPDSVQKVWKSVMGQEHLHADPRRAGSVLYTSITQAQLVQDIKFLLLGMPSQTFQYNEKEDGFVLRNTICLKGLTPGTLHSYCEDFLLAGSCCLRLDKLTTGRSAQEGLMFQMLEMSTVLSYAGFTSLQHILRHALQFVPKALCGSLRRYLLLYRCAVLELPESPLLLVLRQQFDRLYVQISSLASLCKVHPQFSEEALPEGVALLAYLYKEIQKVTRKDVTCILYSVLQACCKVYFSFLQKWMFEGICHDTYSEFFIQERIELMTNRQREYWTQGHCIFMDAVPGFLHGLEERIFQCGKALNLLKLCNPQDPLCVVLQSGYPSIQCCLHDSNETEWCSYQLRAQAACGEPLDIHKLLYQSQEDELCFQEAIQMERLRVLKLEREMERAAAYSVKNRQLAMLKEQMQQAEKLREKQRRERKEEDERIAREAREQEEREARLIELEKASMRSHYLQMSQAAEERRLHAERLIQQMKNSETPPIITSPNNNINPQELYNNTATINNNNNTESRNNGTLNNALNSVVSESTSRDESNSDLTNNAVNSVMLESANNEIMLETNNEINNGILESTNNEVDENNTINNAVSENNNELDEANGNNALLRRHCNMDEGDCPPENVEEKPTSMKMDLEPENPCGKCETARNGLPYTLQMSLGDCPLVNIGDSQVMSRRPVAPHLEDTGTSDMSSISIALQKSILLSLRIQATLVNNALLKLFLEKEELVSHLHSLRNYFFLLDGEFGRNVTSALFECMYRATAPADMLNSVTLNSILYKFLPQSDSNAERLRFDIKYTPPHFTFSSPLSLDCVVLQYKVVWPLNIILTSAALHKYNDVFGFLLRLRRISWVLEEDFHRLKRKSKEIPGIVNSPQFHSLQLYRHEMTHFIHALQSYVTATVLQGSWVEFLKNLENARTLDHVYRMHVAYVKMVLFRCLLNKQSAAIQKALVDTLRMVLKFHGQLCSGAWERGPGMPHYEHPKFATLVQIYQSFHNLAIFIFKFATKLANTGYQPHLLDLLQMLNINNYYP